MVSPPTGKQSGWTSTSLSPERARGRKPRPYRPRVLRDAGIAPAKSLGQHFLIDHGIANRIVAAAELSPNDTVIEVGPGLGVLTERLVEVAGRVIAVEVDKRLAARLSETLVPQHPNLTIVERDVLSVTPGELLAAVAPVRVPPATETLSSPSPWTERGLGGEVGYVVVANLPYNIGAAVLRHFLEATQPPKRLVVMLQREVADSVCAVPGNLGLLGVSVQVYARPRRLFTVPPRAFQPPPKVMSAVIRLDVRDEPLVAPQEREAFFRVVRAGFSAPRKQLANTLAQGLQRPAAELRQAIIAAGIEPSLRPQALSLDDWKRLASTLEAHS